MRYSAQMVEDIRPTAIAQVGPGTLRIDWKDGHESLYPVRLIRLSCPCAVCVEELTGRPLLDEKDVAEDVHPVSVSPVGRYAIRISWTDGHDTGIYSFDRLRMLCPCCQLQS